VIVVVVVVDVVVVDVDEGITFVKVEVVEYSIIGCVGGAVV